MEIALETEKQNQLELKEEINNYEIEIQIQKVKKEPTNT